MTSLSWGINAHASFDLVSAAEQLDLAKSIGMTSLRIDVYDASPTTIAWLSHILTEASHRGMTILPVIVPSAASGTSEAAAYAWGYNTASALASAFPGMTWEVGNEMDMYAVKPGTTGQSTSDYNDAIYAIVRGSIKGMSEGIHQSDSTASVAVGIAGMHFGFLQRLANDAVQWDITSEHYYAPPGSTPHIDSGADFLFGSLAQFGKPIIMTEFNQQQGYLLSQSEQVVTLVSMMNAIAALAPKYNIIGAYLYELLDEPGLDPTEAHYGMANEIGILNATGLAIQEYLVMPAGLTAKLAADTGLSSADRITSSEALQGTADPFAILHFTVDGHAVASTATADTNGNWTFDPAGLLDGQHTIVVSETTISGAIGSTSLTFTLDKAAPAPSWSTMSTSGGVLTLTGSTTGNAYESLQYFDSGTFVGTGVTEASGVFGITTGYNAAMMHVASVVATDIAGNMGTTAGKAYLGSGGRDIVLGSSWADLILGSGGGDTLTGGGGRDKFIYSALTDSPFQESDTILDFVHGVDVIDFTNIAGIDSANGLARFQGNIAATGTIRIAAHSVGYIEMGLNTLVVVNSSNSVKTDSADMMIVLVGVGLGLADTDFHHL